MKRGQTFLPGAADTAAASTRQAPARLHVLLAREADSAVVIRRGPSRHTAVIGWDRRHDRFSMGQWLYGRIYERRSDLSPDGQHMIYFAMNGRWQSVAKGAWTAVSRTPWLKALTLYAKGDCWHGGGLFMDAREYWLNDGYGHDCLEDHSRLQRTAAYPWTEYYGGECEGVYFIRLQRDGWQLRSRGPDGTGGRVTVFEKPLSARWTLRKFAHASLHHPVGRGVYFDRHALCNLHSGEVLERPDWEWADLDRKRLVWAASGRLHAARPTAGGLKDETLLFDFNPLRFERLAAPY